ncbi:MAG: hypothetical protein P4L64_17625 [Caulobacteraceae bacterium]|nr:hypothetical protein [Caulobacteraceae bacterium]
MSTFQARRLWLTIGGGFLALLIPLAIGFAILRHEHASKAPPPASRGGLVVQMGREDDAKPDPTTPLRCFVAGQFVGMETLADCARKNGVAAQALDVGVDSSGALAAAGEAGTNLTPLPPPAAQGDSPNPAAESPATHGPMGDCLRYGGNEWRKLGDAVTLSACVQSLFAGRCEKPGGASYGRWMGQTLRLLPRRVEISADNKTFRTVVEQTDTSCAIPEF